MNKLILITILVFIGIIIGIQLILFTYKRYDQYNMFTIERQNSNKYVVINDEYIRSPKNGYDYSTSFFIFIDDYTYNFNKWRHVYHKGTQLSNSSILNYNDWNDIESNIEEQSPGVWIHPDSLSLRLCFTTETYKKYCSFKDINNCDTKFCKWEKGHCLVKDDHARELNNVISLDNETKSNLEYIDIPIPYKKIKHICFVLENKILNIYLEGKLYKIHTFLGEPIFNSGGLFFNKELSYSGSLNNFKYIPYEIKSKKIKNLYNDIPNIEEIPKNKRINHYLGQFKFKEVFKSFFI